MAVFLHGESSLGGSRIPAAQHIYLFTVDEMGEQTVTNSRAHPAKAPSSSAGSMTTNGRDRQGREIQIRLDSTGFKFRIHQISFFFNPQLAHVCAYGREVWGWLGRLAARWMIDLRRLGLVVGLGWLFLSS